MGINQGEFAPAGHTPVSALPTPSAGLLGVSFFLIQQDGLNKPGFYAVDPTTLSFEEIAGGAGDAFVSTESSTANLQTNFPAADFPGKYALINGSPSNDGIYRSNGTIWEPEMAEATGSGGANDGVADAVTSINTTRGTFFPDWTKFDQFDGIEDEFEDVTGLASQGSWVHDAPGDFLNSASADTDLVSVKKDTLIEANFVRAVVLHNPRNDAVFSDDLVLSVSRDDGATFTPIELIDSGQIFKEITGFTNDLVPTMTSPTAPFGTVTTSAGDGFRVFNDNLVGDSWFIANHAGTEFVEYEFISPRNIVKYTIQSDGNPARMPTAWRFEVFDGTSFITLDTQSGQTGWAINEKRPFTFNNPHLNFTKYRLTLTSFGDQDFQFGEVEMMEDSDDVSILTTKDIDITGTPSGTEVAWKIESKNGKNQDIYGVWLQWRQNQNVSSDDDGDLTGDITSVNTIREADNDWTIFDKIRGIRDEFINGFDINFDVATSWTQDPVRDRIQSNSADSSIQSKQHDSVVVPKFARAVVLHDDRGVAVINTDLKLFVSRNGGGSFTQMTLVDSGHTFELVPEFTLDLTDGPGTPFTSSDLGSTVGNAFDGTDSEWQASGGVVVATIGYEFNTSKVVTRYSIEIHPGSPGFAPQDWTFEASGNGTFTDGPASGPFILDTITGEVGWTGGPTRIFDIPNLASFSHYRLNISANNGESRSVLAELNMFDSLPPVKILTTADEDITGQPDGAKMVWKLESLNTTEQNIHGIWLQWRESENLGSDGSVGATMDLGVKDPVADLAALKALDVTDADDFPDSVLIQVKTIGLFRLDRTSGLTADDIIVVDPTTPSGAERWILIARLVAYEPPLHVETDFTDATNTFNVPNDGSILHVVAKSTSAATRTVLLPDGTSLGFVLDRLVLNIAREGTDLIEIKSQGGDDIILDGVATTTLPLSFNGDAESMMYDPVGNHWYLF